MTAMEVGRVDLLTPIAIGVGVSVGLVFVVLSALCNVESYVDTGALIHTSVYP